MKIDQKLPKDKLINAQQITKKTYQTPTVKQYGTLGELVQHQPGRGGDGDFFPDCSLS